VAIELTAEIKTAHPNKKVTIIHSNDDLFQFAGKSTRARKHLNSLFEKWQVNTLNNERVVAVKNLGTSGYAVATNTDKVVQGDHVILCTGVKPNSEFMKQEYADTLTADGLINVDDKLRVDPQNNIFAFGDVINFMPQPVEKMAFRAREQSPIVSKNVALAVKGKTNALESYKPVPKTPVALASLGYDDGVMVVGVRLVASRVCAHPQSHTNMYVGLQWLLGV
jgi:NADH dehydrogenase FAD-containing subunit